MCAFDVQVFVYTCAPLSDEFETTDSKPGFGQQNQFCVALRSVLFLQKTLSNGADDRIDFFDFFTIEKRELLQQRTFVCRTAIHYLFYDKVYTEIYTVLPFYTNTAFMPTLHINAAHTSISQAYYFIAIYYQSDHSIPLLYKTLIFSNIISTSVSRHTDNTRALYPSHNTACFVTARLAVQLNGIVQNHSTCRFVVTTQLHFPKPSTIILVVATVFSKTVAHNSYRLIYTSVFSE